MSKPFSVAREQRIAAFPDDVWAVVADPSMQPRLDPRCTLESTTGDWGNVGTEFVLVMRGVRLRYMVAESVLGVRWVAEVDRRGKRAAVQQGELSTDGTTTLLRWTVTAWAGPLTRRLAERACESELPRWLTAVEREVLARAR